MNKNKNLNLIVLIINIVLSITLFVINVFYQLPAPKWDLTFKFIGSALCLTLGAINLTCGLIKKNINVNFSITMLVGLALSFGGDVAIEYEFIAGAALFALAHVCYVIGYYFISKFHWLDIVVSLLMAIPSALTIALLSSFDFGSDLLKYVIVGYSIIISFMFGKSISNLIIKKNFHALLIFIGSMLFVASDFCLLLELFTDLGYKWGHGCMALYFPALLVFGYSILFQSKFDFKICSKKDH